MSGFVMGFVTGLCIGLAATALGLDVSMWQWWLFVVSMNVALAVRSA